MLWLERAFGSDADIGGLLRAQLGQFHADAVKVQAGHLLIQMLGQDIDVVLVLFPAGPQLDLGENLVGERRRHHKRRMTSGVAKVQQTALRQQDDLVAGRHLDHVHLVLDVGPLVVLEVRHLNFVVEVADVANDGHVLHLAHMLDADHVLVAGGGDEDVRRGDFILQQHDLKTVHCRLQGADRVGFGDFHTGASAAQRSRRAFANVAIPADNRNLTGHHHVCCAADTVHQGFLAAVFVVELRLGDGIIHVDRGEGQLTFFDQFVKAMNASGCFLGYAFDRVAGFGEPTRGLFHPLFDLGLDDRFFLGLRNGNDVFACLGAGTKQHIKGRIAAIIQDHVCAFRELEGAIKIVPVLFQALALDRKDRNTRFSNRRRSVILGGEDVAGCPTHVCAQRHEGFDQDRGLDGHVQRTNDARAFQRLAFTVLFAQRHQARHFRFSDVEFFAAKAGQRNILDDVITGHCLLHSGFMFTYRTR